MTAPDRTVTHVVCTGTGAFAGVERYICDTSNALVERGWRVNVVGGDPTQMRAALDPAVAYAQASGLVAVRSALAQLPRNAILHTHMTEAEVVAISLPRRHFARWVTTRHFARQRGNTVLGRAVSPLIRSRVDVQVAISQAVAASIDGPSVVVHNGVPPSKEIHAQRDRTVLMMQRLEPEKDTATGLRAWAASGLADEGWRLRVFGQGSQLASLTSLARDLKVDQTVSFEGFSSNSRRELARAGLVLAPCSIDGFGLTVVETMAEGTPVVAADGGAHRETLGDLAPLFPAGDVVAAASALRAVAMDPDYRAELGRSLRDRYRASFTTAKHVDALEQVYLP